MSVLQVRPGEVPTAPFAMSTVARSAYEQLGAITYPDPDNAFAFAALVEAWSTVIGWVDAAARPEPGTGDPPWTQVFDPERCPWWALRWCGQVYGVRLFPALNVMERPSVEVESAWRAEIADRPAWRRGTPASIVSAARLFMVGDMRVTFRERYDPDAPDGTDSPYHVQVRVKASDVVAGQEAALEAAVRAQKPAGLVMHFLITDEHDYDEGRTLSADYDAAHTLNADYDAARGA